VLLASRCAGAGDLPPRDVVAPGGLDGRTWGKETSFV
jgi:hypothetical protein